jgi:hypothetical protein
MTNLKIVKALPLALMVFFVVNAMGQSDKPKVIPSAVLAAFNARYPHSNVKNWELTKDGYVATAKEGHSRYDATFDPDGNWKMTATKIRWTWKLPADVHNGFKKSKYATWEIDGIKKIETPTGLYYQIHVDDGNLQIDAFHEGIFTQDWLIDFTQEGKLSGEENITTANTLSLPH